MGLAKKALDFVMKKLEPVGGFGLYAGVLLAVMFLAYGAQVWRLGFYYDDWEGIFLYNLDFSALQIWQYFLNDRPFSSLVHILYNPFFGGSPLGWHIWGILLNWGAILLLARALLKVWPNHVLPIGWIGLLAALYPGITRQFVVKTSMPHYTSLLLFALSLLLMVAAYQSVRRKELLTALAVLLGCVQVLLIEYFSGLELARFFLLFYLARRDSDGFWQAARRAVLYYLPYALIFGLFVFYRFALLPAMQMAGSVVEHEVSLLAQLSADPAGALVMYANRIAQDVWYAIVYVWTLAIQPQDIEWQSKSTVTAWALGLAAGLAATLGLEAWVRRSGAAQRPGADFPTLVLAVALGSILVGGLPAWMTGKQALVGLWSGRFLFGQFLGAVSAMVLVVMWFIGRERRAFQHLALALLMANAFSLQFRTANKFALDWGIQRDFFWQLKWRVPALQPGSFIVMPTSPLSYTVDYQLAFVTNMLYGSTPGSEAMDYWWFNAPNRLQGYFAREADPTQPVETRFRTITFSSDMSRAVPVLYRPSRGCLLVADAIYTGAPLLSDLDQKMFSATYAPMILPDEAPIPTDVFGSEPTRGWCYHFQKADLARQSGRWDEVWSHWQDAQSAGLWPAYGPEYLPFIEAAARQDDWDTARQLTTQAYAQTEKMAPILCANWQRLLGSTPASDARGNAWSQLQPALACESGG